ncbi:MAG: adenosylcobinamide amidohydrolase [Desulfobacterales bacterium]|jgi:ABC-type Fe3+-hydroxamate transport system substrate-binding protein/adenosylcobinamide amidohydrolase|nr:adenosylcobinamide amidohydrolase [Desulfobacterales bacterium]MDD3082641.1 adenosylcobinamide amidohydrolase [Desulfobacterales bacterium]MDD3951104.1 adenosylcobinamide amidohydrolase [Desulfobacterales bacterium]MDY0378693.1 adenosylcobinamide amidohydrolase [Desulfobacterales bacterium]
MKNQLNCGKSWKWVLVFWISFCAAAWAGPIEITDDAGNQIHLNAAPRQVVSLMPSATEIIFAIGAEEVLTGITLHSAGIPGAGGKTVVGGFFSPSANRILALKPDLVIAASVHSELIARLGGVPALVVETQKMSDAFRHIQMMGELFDRKAAADELVEKNRRQLDFIARKVAKIPEEKRKRVMRLMGRDTMMTPGSDSFQNEMIQAAGGIPPDFGKPGAVVPVTREEWVRFNPQILYGCGGDRKAAESFFSQEGWKSVDAVQHQRIYMFPCDLTCRAASHLGDFVSWFASLIYAEEFSDPGLELLPRRVTGVRPISVALDFVREAAVAASVIHDFENKSLIIDFKSPRTVVSTLEGQRDGILTVGNHYSPPPCWALNHARSLQELRSEIYTAIGRDEKTAAFLFTGADMDNLVIRKETFREMTVFALVTAGVSGNAVRMGTDTGSYYEPGTINMIFLTSMRLTPRAMTRAIISATEGKTAALQDLDIRSTCLPLTAAATGTGTDNIIVVQGDGMSIDNAGGHCKMGELIARAAYAGVREAIFRQNGIAAKRDIFQRLADRHLSVSQLASDSGCDCLAEKDAFAGQVEQALLDPAIAGFLEAAMALSDGAGRETVNDLVLFETWCLEAAGRIAGMPVAAINSHFTDDDMPKPLAMALNAIFTGVSVHLADAEKSE